MQVIKNLRALTVDVAIATIVAGALAGCGSITPAGSGMDAAAGGGRGGATGTAGSDGRGGTTGTGGTTGAGGTTGSGGDATGGAVGAAGRGGTTGAAGIGPGRGGSGGAGGSGVAGRGGSGATGGSGGSNGGAGGRGGAGGGGICTILCMAGRTCCGANTCVNLQNDPFNCGKCGNVCTGTTSFCGGGMCQAPACGPAIDCISTATCCGNTCCGAGQLCCDPQGPIGGVPACYTPTPDQPTCPQGCAPSCKSDRNIKKNIAPADTRAILDKVARLPIATWTYLEEPSGVRHLGPMAQDFHASFGLGNDDRTYNSVDAHGVALAAIQALERMVAAQEQRIQALERDNRRLERRLRADDSRRPSP